MLIGRGIFLLVIGSPLLWHICAKMGIAGIFEKDIVPRLMAFHSRIMDDGL